MRKVSYRSRVNNLPPSQRWKQSQWPSKPKKVKAAVVAAVVEADVIAMVNVAREASVRHVLTVQLKSRRLQPMIPRQ